MVNFKNSFKLGIAEIINWMKGKGSYTCIWHGNILYIHDNQFHILHWNGLTEIVYTDISEEEFYPNKKEQQEKPKTWKCCGTELRIDQRCSCGETYE